MIITIKQDNATWLKELLFLIPIIIPIMSSLLDFFWIARILQKHVYSIVGHRYCLIVCLVLLFTTLATGLKTYAQCPVYNMRAGSSSYSCGGSAGSIVAMGGSSVGFKYQLIRNGNSTIGNLVDGNGASTMKWTVYQPGTYTVMEYGGSCGGGKLMSGSTVITDLGAAPTVRINAQASSYRCIGNSISFSAQNGTNYSWYNNGNQTGNTTATFSPSTTQAGTYTIKLEGYNACGVLQSDQVTLYVTDLVSSVSPSGTKKICSTCSELLTGTIGSAYVYQWTKNGTTISGANSSTYTANQDGNYAVIISGNSCTDKPSTNSLSLLINKVPIANAGNDQEYTAPVNSVTLNGSATDSDGNIVSAAWTKSSGPNVTIANSNTLTPTISDLIIGEYNFRLTVIDDFGEANIDEIKITVAAPPNNYNYVIEKSALVSGISVIGDINAKPVDQKTVTTTFFDGLGRPVQNVAWSASPDLHDIVQPVVYDQWGREKVKYLPYTSGNTGYFKSDFIDKDNPAYKTSISPQYQFYQNTLNVGSDSVPYMQTAFEPSPLNRVLKQGASGSVWQPNADIYSMTDKTVKKRYELNSDNEVLRLSFDLTTGMISESELAAGKYYGVNQLYANKTYDEKNNEVIEYVDKEGRMVCKKVYVKTENNIRRYAETYYIYDDFGNLVLVLPPEGVEKLKTALNLN